MTAAKPKMVHLGTQTPSVIPEMVHLGTQTPSDGAAVSHWCTRPCATIHETYGCARTRGELEPGGVMTMIEDDRPVAE